jgi:hypothetical protein
LTKGKTIPLLIALIRKAEKIEDKGFIRMVTNYDPGAEMVIVIIIYLERTSAYQIQLQKRS